MTLAPLPRRPNYFDGQDLGSADFLAERGHLDGLRKLYNTGLHTWGIASGLGVTAGGDQRSVAITPGLAIQPSGQEILLTEPTSLATPNLGGQPVNLFIVSRATRADPSQASLASGFKRLDHVATPFFAAAGATVDDQAVFLATVVLAEDGEVSAVQLGPRRPCGFEVGALSFVGPDDDIVKAGLAIAVEEEVPRLALLADAVQVTGAFELAGGLMIGDQPLQSPRAALDVQSSHGVLLSLRSSTGQALLSVNQAGQTSLGGPPAGAADLTVSGDIGIDAGHALLLDGPGALQSGSSVHSIALGGAQSDGMTVFTEAGDIAFYSGATAASRNPTLIVAASGDVGIGVAAPAQALVVDGSVQSLSGGFILGDSPVQTTTAVSATVQVGAIIEWWSAGGKVSLPPYFVICDGSQITDPLSPFHGQNSPDLVNHYVLGTADYGAIGQTGGSGQHTHQIDTIPAHTHSIIHQHPPAGRTTNTDPMEGDGLNTDNKCSGTGHDHSLTISLAITATADSLPNASTLPAFNTSSASSLPASAGLMMILRIR